MILRFTTLAAISALCVAWEPAPTDLLVSEDIASVERGPAIGEPQVAPYFTTPELQAALADLQAGRAASALRRLPRNPETSPLKWLRALARDA